jgi:hypothetical protein
MKISSHGGEIMDPEDRRQGIAIRGILNEMEYQRRRWSVKEDEAKPPEYWLGVLAIYLGKAGQETPVYQGSNFNMSRFRKRVTQIGAICATILEVTGGDGHDGRDAEEQDEG